MSILEALEPWCDRIYIDEGMQEFIDSYIDTEQSNTKFDLTKRVFCIGYNDPEGENDIVVDIDGKRFGNNEYYLIQQLTEIIKDSGELGTFKLNSLQVTIITLQSYEQDLIVV